MEGLSNQGQQWNDQSQGPGLGLPLQMGMHPHSVPQERPPEVLTYASLVQMDEI